MGEDTAAALASVIRVDEKQLRDRSLRRYARALRRA
jgi:hypothetical protein